MNIKFQDIINFNINSQKLTKGELPLTCAYKLTKISKILAEEADFYQTEFFKIVDEYGEKDEKGNIKYSEDGTVVLIEPSKQKEAQEKINNLNNMEIEVNIEPYLLEFSDFDSDKKITMEEMSSLWPFRK